MLRFVFYLLFTICAIKSSYAIGGQYWLLPAARPLSRQLRQRHARPFNPVNAGMVLIDQQEVYSGTI
jgi:hypothetical protein